MSKSQPTTDLQTQYDALREAALIRLARGQVEHDPWLDAPQDTRRGVTLLTRPPAPIITAIENILADFQRDEPAHYYYPSPDIHLTILSIISCHAGFRLDAINPADYQALVRAVLERVRPFTITFRGLAASAGGIMVQGFPHNDALAEVRESIRQAFRQSGLQQSIDQRYTIQTAHATIIRFRKEVLAPALLIEKLKQYQHAFIDTFEVDKLELVYNDWYQRASNTVLLEAYPLG